MRSGVEVQLNPGDRERLEAVVVDRNSIQKHVWRAEIVLLTADGIGTNEIMRRTGKSKPCVWRWQERFMTFGDRRSRAFQAIPPSRRAFRPDAEALSVRREGCQWLDLQDRRLRRAQGAVRGSAYYFDQAGQSRRPQELGHASSHAGL